MFRCALVPSRHTNRSQRHVAERVGIRPGQFNEDLSMTVENLPQPTGMAQCAVTGKMFPEDELVTIQGQRVCAEGKAILLERLRSGESAPHELEKPTVLRRFGCIFVDGLIIGVPTAVVTGMVGRGNPVVTGCCSIASTVVQVIYFGQLHGTVGKSVGKMAGKLRVVNMDGSAISLGTGYVRAVAYCGLSVLSGIAAFLGSPAIVLAAGGIASLYGLANIIVALVDSRAQRAIHDRIAGTRVVTAG